MPDSRVAYGARCTWWDSIDKVGTFAPKRPGGVRGTALPVCPFCRGTLFEKPDEASWLADAEAFDKNGHEGYLAFVLWSRGKCFPGPASARAAYVSETGKDFVL